VTASGHRLRGGHSPGVEVDLGRRNTAEADDRAADLAQEHTAGGLVDVQQVVGPGRDLTVAVGKDRGSGRSAGEVDREHRVDVAGDGANQYCRPVALRVDPSGDEAVFRGT